MNEDRRIEKWLYKEILLKAAEEYDWDQSEVTDLYVRSVFEETGGDVKRLVKGIYRHAGKDERLVTDEAVNELLDSYRVIDPVNTPSTSSLVSVQVPYLPPQQDGFVNTSRTSDEVDEVDVVPYRLPEQDGFNMQGSVEPLEHMRMSIGILQDNVDSYYGQQKKLTPLQKEAMALRRFQSAQKAILGKYGNGEEAQKRLQEQRATIIEDFDLEEVDGQVRVKPEEVEAYKVYCQGALYGPLKEDKVVELKPDDYVGRAGALNEEFRELDKNRPPEKSIYSGMGQILMMSTNTPDMYGAYQRGKRNAAQLLNNATIDLVERHKDAEQRSTFGNVAVGTLEGVGTGLIDMGLLGPTVEFVDFARNEAVRKLEQKMQELMNSLGQELEGEELQARVYGELTDEEINLLESAENYYRAVEVIEKNFPQSRRVGGMVGEGLVGMVEFWATGGGGWLRSAVKVGGKTMMRKVVRQVGKEAVKKAVGSAGRKVIMNKVLNAGGKVAKDQVFNLVEAAAQTMIQPSYYMGVADRISQGQSHGTAWVEAWYDKLVDNYTARVFGDVPVLGSMAKGGVGKLANFSDKILKEYSEEVIADFMKRFPDWKEQGFELAYADFWEDKADVLYSAALMTGMVEGAKAMKGVRLQYGKDAYRKVLPKYLVDNMDRLLDETDITSRETLQTIGVMLDATARKEGIALGKLIEDTHRYLLAKFQAKGMEYAQNKADDPEVKAEPEKEKNGNEVDNMKAVGSGQRTTMPEQKKVEKKIGKKNNKTDRQAKGQTGQSPQKTETVKGENTVKKTTAVNDQYNRSAHVGFQERPLILVYKDPPVIDMQSQQTGKPTEVPAKVKKQREQADPVMTVPLSLQESLKVERKAEDGAATTKKLPLKKPATKLESKLKSKSKSKK